MTQPMTRLLHGVVARVCVVLADLGWLVVIGLVSGLVLVAFSVLVLADTWLLMAEPVVVFTVFPRLLFLPARYLSAWMPTGMAVVVTLVMWLAVADEALRVGEAAGRTRVRRLAASLATCLDMGAALSPRLKRRVKRVVQARMSHAVGDLELEEAARWLSAEDALRVGDYQTVAATLAQAAPAEAAGMAPIGRLRRCLRLVAAGAVLLFLLWTTGGQSVVRGTWDTCLSCPPHSAREHRLWP